MSRVVLDGVCDSVAEVAVGIERGMYFAQVWMAGEEEPLFDVEGDRGQVLSLVKEYADDSTASRRAYNQIVLDLDPGESHGVR